MTRWVREFRLIPIALIAIGALFVLKTAGLILDNGYTLGQRLSRGETLVVTTVPASSATQLRSETVPLNIASAPPPGTRTWAREMFNYPGPNAPAVSANDANLVTGSVAASKPPPEPAKPAEPPAAKPTEPPGTKPAAVAPPPSISPAERAVLERLQERRQQLEARARELDIRESLLKAAEQKLEKAAHPPATATPGDTTATKPADASPFKSLVTMYETMKPKDAAKIFDRLDIKVLIEVSTQINPRRMSEILALMSPEAAERLTVELASRARNDKTPNPAELPKIEGKPLGG